MITLDEAQKRIDGAVNELSMALLPLTQAVGCCLGEDIVAPFNVPDFANSAIDGITLRISDLKGDGPWTLPIQAVIATGKFVEEPLLPTRAARIMTGAALITGADTVIPIEDVTINNDHVIIADR